jgi:hypothetical protein
MEIAKIKGKKKQKETKREYEGTKRNQTNQSEMKKEPKIRKIPDKNDKKHKIGLFFIRANKKYFNAYIRSKEYVFSKDVSELFRHE